MSYVSRILLLVGLVTMNLLGFGHTPAAVAPTDPPRVAVMPPPKARLAFNQQPMDTVQDSLILPGVEVQVESASGTPVADVPVQVKIADGVLRGTTTAYTDSRGVARFDTLVISQPGSYVIQAQAGNLPPVDSAAFAVFRH
ncbi:MAG: Ig-like domain-containing protein [Candidatus Xenobia bacterium]